MAGIYKRAVKVAPNTPILIAQAKGLKNILETSRGKNPPMVVTDVVMICLVERITTSINPSLVRSLFSFASLI